MSQHSISSSLSPVHLRDVQDKTGKLQSVPAPAQREFSLLLMVVVVLDIVIVVIITNNIVISIIITIIRTVATQGAGLARWWDLPLAAGYLLNNPTNCPRTKRPSPQEKKRRIPAQ